MNDRTNLSLPDLIGAIEEKTKALKFSMASDHLTGSLLRTLVSAKRSSKVLELGIGTGFSTCWMLDGLDGDSELVSVDYDPAVVEIAKEFLSSDPRVKFHVEDGSAFLKKLSGESFDFIFADTWPGKYWDLDLALDLLAEGGLYVIDDMLPQENWPEDHPQKVEKLIEELETREDLRVTKMNWSTGIILVSRKAQPVAGGDATR